MAKKKAKEEVEPKKGLDIKVELKNISKGINTTKLQVTVTLLQDGVEIASDYDFISII